MIRNAGSAEKSPFNNRGQLCYSSHTHDVLPHVTKTKSPLRKKEAFVFTRNRSVVLESMEIRRLLSFASLNTHGTLSVVGTGGNDSITLQFTGTKVQAILNGQTLSFNKSNVKRIFAEGFGENDHITNKTSRPSTLIGDSGNDTLTGGSADDSLTGGSGDDHLDGGLGTNTIPLGSGHDMLDYSADGATAFTLDEFPPDLTGDKIHRFNDTATDVVSNAAAGYTVLGTSGNDTFNATDVSNPNIKIDLGGGNDTFRIGNGEIGAVDGGSGNDKISYGPDSLIVSVLGGSGNDTINDDYGGTGTLLIDGGSGTDTYNLSPDQVQMTDPVYARCARRHREFQSRFV